MSEKNYSGIQRNITNSILKTGASLINKFSTSRRENLPKKLEKKKRCKLCKLTENTSAYKDMCCECESAICPTHTVIYCTNCNKI